MAIKSPCNSVCRIDHRSGFCIGCGRDLSEIQEWPDATDNRRRQILLVLPQRLEAMATTIGTGDSLRYNRSA